MCTRLRPPNSRRDTHRFHFTEPGFGAFLVPDSLVKLLWVWSHLGSLQAAHSVPKPLGLQRKHLFMPYSPTFLSHWSAAPMWIEGFSASLAHQGRHCAVKYQKLWLAERVGHLHNKHRILLCHLKLPPHDAVRSDKFLSQNHERWGRQEQKERGERRRAAHFD